MSLQVWLPLNRDLQNQGLADVIVTTSTSPVFKDYGKIGGKCLDLSTRIAFNCPALSGVTTFSVAFWVKLEDDSNITTNWQDIISFVDQKADDSGTGVLRAETCYGNTNYNGVHWHDNAGYCMSKSGETLPTHYSGDRGIWHHCVMTIDSNKEVKSYTDGVLLGTYVASGGGHLTGAFHLGENNLIVGGIADVRIWDEVISMVEVKQISQGLVIHYKLSGIGGENILTNSTGYNGTTNWGGLTTVDNENGSPYLIAKRTDTTSTSRTFCYHSAITSLVSSWSAGDSFTISGYYRVPSNEAYEVGANLFIRWTHTTTSGSPSSDTGFTTPLTAERDKWIRFENTYTVPVNYENGAVNFYISAFAKGLSTVHWKNVKLEKGDKATPWTPSPSDAEYTALGFNDGIEYDCSGFGNDGTKTGTLTTDSNTARYTTSTYISHGANERITTPSLYLNKDAVTLNIWFKSTNTSPTNNYHMVVDSVANRQWYEMCVNKDGYFRGGLFVNGTRYANNCTAKKTALNGEWHMLTITYDSTAVKLYYDGSLEQTMSVAAATGLSSPTAIVLGRDGPNANYACVEVSLSDFRIYSTALSADDILTLYNTAATIDNQGNLFAYEVVEG